MANRILRLSGNMLHKKHVPMQHFPLYLKKAGLASRNIVHLQKKKFYVVSVSAFIFFILFVKPIRSLLIQRIRAGSSFRLLAFKTFNFIVDSGTLFLDSLTHQHGVILSPPLIATSSDLVTKPLQINFDFESRSHISENSSLIQALGSWGRAKTSEKKTRED